MKSTWKLQYNILYMKQSKKILLSKENNNNNWEYYFDFIVWKLKLINE